MGAVRRVTTDQGGSTPPRSTNQAIEIPGAWSKWTFKGRTYVRDRAGAIWVRLHDNVLVAPSSFVQVKPPACEVHS